MDDNPRQNLISKARAILNNSAFKARTEDGKQEVIQILLERGLRSDDLQMLLKEMQAEQTTRATSEKLTKFAILDTAALSGILVKLKPQDVISMCQTDKMFRRVCHNPILFTFLIENHYPNSLPTDNPRRQYIALTRGIETSYETRAVLTENGEGRTDAVKIGKSQRPETTESWSLDNVDPDTILKLLKNPIFMGWLDKDDDGYQIGQKLYIVLGRAGENLMDQTRYDRDRYKLELSVHLSHFLPYFLSFLIDYREKGLISIVLEDTVRRRLDGDEETAKAALENLPGLLDEILQTGKPKSKTPSSGNISVFVIKGNPVPTGSIGWLISHFSSGKRGEYVAFHDVVLGRSREQAVQYFIERYYGRILAGALSRFLRMHGVDRANYDLETSELMKTEEFIRYMADSASSVNPLTKENIYQYLLAEHYLGTPNSGTFSFFPLTFA